MASGKHGMRGGMRIAVCALASVLLGVSGSAMGQPATGKPFQIYWNTTTNYNPYDNPSQRDWRLDLKLDGLPERHDIVIIYEQHVKEYDKLGPMKYWTKKGFKKYIQSLQSAIDARVPDKDFTGIVIIDYEAWGPKYKYCTEVVRKAWKAEQLKLFPQLKSDPKADEIVEANYDKLAKGFWLETIKAGKAYRPKAKWGYYDCPVAYQSGEYAKPDPNPAKQHNDEWKWLFDEVDILCPSTYEWKRTVPADTPNFDYKTQWTPEQHRLYHTANIREAKRLANGRPVLPYICSRYHLTAGAYGEKIVDAQTVDVMLEIYKEEGIDGVIFWGSLHNQEQVDDKQGWVENAFIPALIKHGLIDPDGTLKGDEEEEVSTPVNKDGKVMPLPGGNREKKRQRRDSGVWTYPNGNYNDR